MHGETDGPAICTVTSNGSDSLEAEVTKCAIESCNVTIGPMNIIIIHHYTVHIYV